MHDVIIIGGGLAGLVNAICLKNAGLNVVLIEKKTYPFHRVCGEYVSNEVVPFLQRIGADPYVLNPARIDTLQLTSPYGTSMELPLEMGGFGISRYKFDEYLYQVAKHKGVIFYLNEQVSNVKFDQEIFEVKFNNGSLLNAKIVIGAYGKRSNLDRTLERKFFTQKSPYIGVKYHIKKDIPENIISLHNFKDGYCGISRIEDGKSCLCYLTTRENLRRNERIPLMEKNLLSKNPYLKEIFETAEFLFEQPEIINEISFDRKSTVTNHILMSGDAAGMITPLCGNGMAMAIHSAKILSDLIIKKFHYLPQSREQLEKEYTEQWNKIFEKRLALGRQIQKFFGKESVTDFSIKMLRKSKSMSNWLVKQTHGVPF